MEQLILPPTVLNSDCLDGLLKLEDNIFDICLIDAPYFDYKTGHRQDKKGILSQSLVQQDRKDQLRVVDECIRVLKPGSSFWYFTNWQEAWWFQQKFHTFLRNEIIWDKGNWSAGDLSGSFGNKYEVIFLGTKGDGWKYTGERLHDIWTDIPRMGTNRVHPTEKPVQLYEKIIKIACPQGGYILDPYLGSGSSAEAAIRQGCNFLGYEIKKEFYDLIVERLKGVK